MNGIRFGLIGLDWLAWIRLIGLIRLDGSVFDWLNYVDSFKFTLINIRLN